MSAPARQTLRPSERAVFLAIQALREVFHPDVPDDAWIQVGEGGEQLTAGELRRWIAILQQARP